MMPNGYFIQRNQPALCQFTVWGSLQHFTSEDALSFGIIGPDEYLAICAEMRSMKIAKPRPFEHMDTVQRSLPAPQEAMK